MGCKKWDGAERRKLPTPLEEKLIAFMSRTDQRNYDRDLAHAVQDEILVKHDERLTKIETFKTSVMTTIYGIPLIASIVAVAFKLGQFFVGINHGSSGTKVHP